MRHCERMLFFMLQLETSLKKMYLMQVKLPLERS